MDPSKPYLPAPSDAGGRAACREEASSSSSPPPPPPPPQGHAIPPVPLPQASLPVDHGAHAFPFGLESPERRMGELYLTDSPRRERADASRGSRTSPRDRSDVYGHDWPHPTLPRLRVHHDETTRGGASYSRQEQPGPIRPPHPQLFGPQQPLQQQRYAAQTWPQPPPQQQRYAAQTWPQPPPQQRYAAQTWPQPPLPQQSYEAQTWPQPPLQHQRYATQTWPQPPLQHQRYAAQTWPQPPPQQQRYAAQTWPQLQHYRPHFGPEPPQCYAGGEASSSRSEEPTPPIHEDPRLDEFRTELLLSPTRLEELLMSRPESSAFVVHLLDHGGEEMLHCVLAGFVHGAHRIMGNRQGHAVFGALLRICRFRREELRRIVEAAVEPNLVSRTDDGCRVTSLKMLIAGVAPHHNLSVWLLDRFVHERVMDKFAGHQLLDQCFTSMQYEQTRALVLHALDTIENKLQRTFGSMSLCTCVRHAEDEELRRFEDIASGRAADLARGRCSNYFVQRVLDRGSTPFRENLVRELMQHVALLSGDQFGNYVVQHCFLNQETGLPQAELLPIVLRAFMDLPRQELQGLVQHTPSNLVLCSLLKTGITRSPELTRDLARRIDFLDEHVLEQPHSQMVMWFVERILFPDFFPDFP